MAEPVKIPTTIISGFLGVGKTTALDHLLRQRPAHERWALLINEFGAVGIDAASLEVNDDTDHLAIKELAGGCICCTSGVSFQIDVTLLLQRARFDRLLIEPTGIAKPGALLDMICGPGLAPRLEPRAVLTLVDPQKLLDPQYTTHEIYLDQLEAADVLIANRCDLATPEALEAFESLASGYEPPKLEHLQVSFGQLPLRLLDLDARGLDQPRQVTALSATTPPQPTLISWPKPQAATGQAQPLQALGLESCGWRFAPQRRFSASLLNAWMRGLYDPRFPARAIRSKGIFHTDRGWMLIEADEQGVYVKSSQHRRDSRVEIIASSIDPEGWATIERALLEAALDVSS